MIGNQSKIGFLLSLRFLVLAFGSIEVCASDFGTVTICEHWSIADLALLIEANPDIRVAD